MKITVSQLRKIIREELERDMYGETECKLCGDRYHPGMGNDEVCPKCLDKIPFVGIDNEAICPKCGNVYVTQPDSQGRAVEPLCKNCRT